ncbi:Hypothetical predicted protein [Mytilus galloprovincialis]|uniref:EGF-like domain-containing protein n=1 Tax=Mytilus galloprovincialis TaxID=29158 RepID=A0A8B6C375_MYTGA|nr:Hypothetical predicted protein [Mytilus galloprovincialis]
MSITSKDSKLVLIVLICFFSTIHCTRICYSCTNLQENEKCLHAVQCQNDEVCFTQKYQTSENVIRYDVGCTYPEICRKDLTGNLVGRRSDHSHMMCQKCCNGSHVCNDELTCDNSLIVPKQNCLSCSEVKSPALCTNITVCHEHEACFLHKFKTEDNQENFDLGCKDKSLCLHASTSNGFGRRSSPGRHLVCENCCSGSDSCNRDLLCGHHMQEGPNSTCTLNSECESNLVCLSSRCQCLSSDYFWNGFVCMTRKSINEECEESRQCKLSLQCRNKKCQCIESNYWTGSTCAERKSLNGTCATLMECRDTLFCVHSICRCDYYIGETWDGYSCGTVDNLGGSDKDVNIRIGKPGTAFNMMGLIWKARNITLKTKNSLFNSNVKIILFMELEAWETTINLLHKLQVFITSASGASLTYRPEKISNKDLWEKQPIPVDEELKKEKWRWIGHHTEEAKN